MKKYLLIIIMISLLLVGCTKEKERRKSLFFGEHSSGVTYNTQKMHDGKIILLVRNNNTSSTKLKVKIIFVDKQDKELSKHEETIESVSPNEEYLLTFDSIDKYDNYIFELYADKASVDSKLYKLNIEETNDGDNVFVKVKNKDKMIAKVNLVLAFYDKNNIAAYRIIEIDTLGDKEEKSFTYKMSDLAIEFDNYKVLPMRVY